MKRKNAELSEISPVSRHEGEEGYQRAQRALSYLSKGAHESRQIVLLPVSDLQTKLPSIGGHDWNLKQEPSLHSRPQFPLHFLKQIAELRN